MRLFQIIDLLKDYLSFAIVILCFFGLAFLLFYKVIYRSLMHGEKKVKTTKLILFSIFIIYITIVLCATFANRGSAYNSELNLNLFSSYKDAYYTGIKSAWLNIILNILLFTPMGFLLPLLNNKLKSWYKTIGISFLVTLLIEFFQFFTNFGIFEIDDIFNNTLGSIIGYSAVSILFLIINKNESKGKKLLKFFVFCTPCIATILFFTITFTNYDNQQFGNLTISAYSNINMENIKLENNNLVFNSGIKKAPVYKADLLSEDEVIEKAKEIFNSMDTKIDTKYKIDFDNFATKIHSQNGEILFIDYLGGTYTLGSTANFKPEATIQNQLGTDDIAVAIPTEFKVIKDKKKIINKMNELGINLDDYTYSYKLEGNLHIFTVDMYEDKNGFIIDGTITCELHEDGNYQIVNKLIKYSKIDECEIISEQDAYDNLQEGKFNSDLIQQKPIKKIFINSFELDYLLDSKNFYQPIYKFSVFINDNKTPEYICIPALLK